MAKNSGNASKATSRLHDPVTTDTAVSLIRTLLACAPAEERTFNSEECNSDAVGTKADNSRDGIMPWNAAAKLAQPSRAELEVLQQDIVLVDGHDSNEARVQQEQHDVADSPCVDGDRNIENDPALDILIDGLRTGRLIAAFLVDTDMLEIPLAYWATGDSRATARQGYRLKQLGDGPGGKFVEHHAVVSKSDVFSLVGAAKPKNRGGRPVEYNWEEIMFEIWAYATERGIPETQARFFDDVAVFLGETTPRSETALKARTDRVFKEITRIKQSNSNSRKS